MLLDYLLIPTVYAQQIVATSTVRNFWNDVTADGLRFLIDIFTFTLPAIIIIGFALFVVRFVSRKFFGW